VWDRIITLNLKGTFMSCQAVGRTMLERGSGSIINIASIGASIAYPHTTAYLQSKGGVAQMTRSLALEWIDRCAFIPTKSVSVYTERLIRRSICRAMGSLFCDYGPAALLKTACTSAHLPRNLEEPTPVGTLGNAPKEPRLPRHVEV